MTKIKFCGLRSVSDIEAVNLLRPDFAGFVLAPKFWRCVSRETAKEMKAALSPEIPAVGVFVDNGFDEVAGYLEDGIIDIAQLHGAEDESFIKMLQSCGFKVIKAFKIGSESDAERARLSPADLILLDSGTGTGKLFDWSLIENFGRDFILAGGLTPENAADAVRRCRPYCVDVSSGIETDRNKDKEKMRRFIEAVRSENI